MHTQGQSVQQPASLPISIVVRSSAPPAHAKAPLSMRKSSVEKRRRVRPEIIPAIPGFFLFREKLPASTETNRLRGGRTRVSSGVLQGATRGSPVYSTGYPAVLDLRL